PRHSRRNAARRISHRRAIGNTGSRDRRGARRTRLSDEPMGTAFARRRAGPCDQLESLLRDLADPAVHARQPDGFSLGARDFLVLVSRCAVPVAVSRLHEGGLVRQGRGRDRVARPFLRRSRNRLAPVRARLGSQDRARIGAVRLDLGSSIPQLFLAAALLNAGVAIYIYTLVPEFLMRFLIWLLVHTVYRLDKSGLEHIPESGPAVLICNHVSYVDALVIAAACP